MKHIDLCTYCACNSKYYNCANPSVIACDRYTDKDIYPKPYNKIKTNTKSGFILAFKCAIDSPFRTIIILKTKTRELTYNLNGSYFDMDRYNASIRKAMSRIRSIPAKELLI